MILFERRAKKNERGRERWLWSIRWSLPVYCENIYLEEYTATRKRQVRKMAEKFVVDNDELFYRSKKDNQVNCLH